MSSTIKEEFDKLIADVFPDKNGACSLTYRKKKEFERIFFAGYRTCLTSVMLACNKSEDEASKEYDRMLGEIDAYFR